MKAGRKEQVFVVLSIFFLLSKQELYEKKYKYNMTDSGHTPGAIYNGSKRP